jgi:hypothetical protein
VGKLKDALDELRQHRSREAELLACLVRKIIRGTPLDRGDPDRFDHDGNRTGLQTSILDERVAGIYFAIEGDRLRLILKLLGHDSAHEFELSDPAVVDKARDLLFKCLLDPCRFVLVQKRSKINQLRRELKAENSKMRRLKNFLAKYRLE